ncbi:hypothetical protein [Flavobacterium sp.]|uniref:hypothetical protein n=1 Tax=Flavobacterium sp. TaxID=239 RepID=UPI0039E52FA7
MNSIDYFKLQAKNLYRDFKTQTPVADKSKGGFKYDYSRTYFQIYDIISDFGIDEDNFTLMNAQHVIAKIAGFDKWTTLIKTEASELELAKLLFEHQDKIDSIAWDFYIADCQAMNEEELDAETQVEIFKQVVIEDYIFDMEIDCYLITDDVRQIIREIEQEDNDESQIMEKESDRTNISISCGKTTDSFEKLQKLCREEADKLSKTITISNQETISVPFWTSNFPELIGVGKFSRNESGSVVYTFNFDETTL